MSEEEPKTVIDLGLVLGPYHKGRLDDFDDILGEIFERWPANETPTELLALITVMVDDTDPNMSVEYYQKRLEVIGMIAQLAHEKSGAE